MGLDAVRLLCFDLLSCGCDTIPAVRVCHLRRVGVISFHGYCHIMQTHSNMLKMPPHENYQLLSIMLSVCVQIWHFVSRLSLSLASVL